jgi:hypothetical protein
MVRFFRTFLKALFKAFSCTELLKHSEKLKKLAIEKFDRKKNQTPILPSLKFQVNSVNS